MRAAAIAALLASAAAVRPAEAKVLMTQEEALRLAFGERGRPERRTAYLTDEQSRRVRGAAGTDPASRVVVWYADAADPGGPAAFFDTHVVRTLPETVQVVVGRGGEVRRVDILSFDEPEEYLPRPRWFEQFPGRRLDDDLSTRGAIRAVTGATLSSRSIVEAVRRALALHAILAPGPPPPGGQAAPAPREGGRP